MNVFSDEKKFTAAELAQTDLYFLLVGCFYKNVVTNG